MKKIFLLTFSFAVASLINAQSVGIGTASPNSSAMLDISSTNSGLLVPRMTAAQRAAIAAPANGLMVYDTDAGSFYYYNGSSWNNLTAASGSNWKLTGNNGTNPLTHFIGTTDNLPLYFRVNNQLHGYLTYNGNIFFGKDAGLSNSAYSNVAIGTQALLNNTDRGNLVAIGDSALMNNGIGAISSTFSRYNTAVGSKALYANTTGSVNTAIGFESLKNNTTGQNNTASGSWALLNNGEGINNTATGVEALKNNTWGSDNTAIGVAALGSNTTGAFNTSVGSTSLAFNNNGYYNTAAGYNSAFHNTSGYSNVAIGSFSLFYNSTKSNLVAIGDSALFNNGLGAATNEAIRNTAVGSKALYSNTTGSYNNALGYLALYSNSSGNYNNAYGHTALENNTTGIYNAAFGHGALVTNNTGSRNTAYGSLTMTANAGGSQNTSLGYQSMNSNTTGNANVAVGGSALTGNLTGSNNTAVGYNADVSANNLNNATAIGYNASVNASNKVVIGNSSVTSIGGFANWSNFSDGRFKRNVKEDVPGLSFINKLRPVTYTLDVDAINDFNSKGLPADKKQLSVNPEKKNEIYTGFMAQEVEQAARELGFNFSGIDKPKDDSKQTYALRYGDFVVPLIKAMQEQQKQIEELKQKVTSIDNLKKEIEELKKMITQIKH